MTKSVVLEQPDTSGDPTPTRYVDFIFYYGKETEWEDPNIIFRADSQPAMPVNLELFNETSSNIILKKPSSSQVSDDNCHFELRFERGVLSEPDKVTSQDSSWILKYVQGKRQDQFYLLNTNGLTLQPTTHTSGNGVSIPLQNLVADSRHTSPITTVTLFCRKLTQQGKTLDGKSATNTIAVMSRPANVSLPLEVGFISSNFVLNDGGTENELVLRILNHSNLGNSIDFNGKDSQFILTFDYSDSSANWALMKNSNSIGNKVTVVLCNESGVQQPEQWQATQDPNHQNKQWLIKPKSESGKLKDGY